MKKKTIVAVLVVLIVLLVAALLLMQSRSKAPENAPQSQAQNAQSAQNAPVAEATPAVLQEDELTVNAQAQDISAELLPVIDAEIRAMRSAESGYFDMENADMCWNALATLCSSEKLPAGIAEVADDATVKISKDNMRRLAEACFASRSELPELPENNEAVKYDEGSDTYVVKKAEADELKCEIMETRPTSDGGYTLAVALLNGSAQDLPLVSTYSFDVLPYPAEQTPENPVFSMCVFGGYDVCNVLAQVTAVEEVNGEYKIGVHPVQLHWENDGEGEEGEAYVPSIVADTKPDEELKLYSLDMADWNTIGNLMGRDEEAFKTSEEAWKWFTENFETKVEEESVVYQMRVYKDTIYSMAPLYSFYFAG